MDGPEPPNVTIDYIATEELTPVDDPAKATETLLDGLNSKDWLLVFNTLATLRQLTKHNSGDIAEQADAIFPAVLKSVKSPRSTLSKSGLMAVTDLFTFCPEQAQRVEKLKDLLLQLLLKASADKKFLGDEAEKALASMAKNFPPHLALAELEPFCGHNNGKVRAKATSTYQLAASAMDPAQLKDYGFDKILRVAGKQISDQLPEAREAARKLAQGIHAAYTELAPAGGRKSEEGTSSAEDALRGNAGNETADGREGRADEGEAGSETKAAAEPEVLSWEEMCKSVLPALQCNAILACVQPGPSS